MDIVFSLKDVLTVRDLISPFTTFKFTLSGSLLTGVRKLEMFLHSCRVP